MAPVKVNKTPVHQPREARKRKLKKVLTKKPTVQDEDLPPAVVESDKLEPVAKKGKWTNKERVLVFSSRGILGRDRHLMLDVRNLLPHAKPTNKISKKVKLFEINDIAVMNNCNKVLYFEARKRKDLYLWLANVPDGPSVKFSVENVHTMEELKMTGNCLKGSRPLLTFGEEFDTEPHYKILKELFTQVFSTPYNHPKSQPFVDKVFTFSIVDKRIWFRNFQIVEETGALAEIGPRFCLNPSKIFAGSLEAAVLWRNPDYVSPNLHRRLVRRGKVDQYLSSKFIKEKSRTQKEGQGPSHIPEIADDVFKTIAVEQQLADV